MRDGSPFIVINYGESEYEVLRDKLFALEAQTINEKTNFSST